LFGKIAFDQEERHIRLLSPKVLVVL